MNLLMTKPVLVQSPKDLTIDFSKSIFWTCASFEKRLQNASMLFEKKFQDACVFYNKEFKSVTQESLELTLHSRLSDRIKGVEISISEPIVTGDIFLDLLLEYGNSIVNYENIVIDISTFTREHLLIILKIVSYLNITNIIFLYIAANHLSTSWLTRGYSSVRSVLGYSGDYHFSDKTHLILMMGFEKERAITIIEEYQPDLISIGIGKNGDALDLYKRNINYAHELAAVYGSAVDLFQFSLDDANNCSFDIEEQYHKIKEQQEGAVNTIISPLNNKISTIGCGLFLLRNDDVQACYAEAISYNFSDYSKDYSKLYRFNICSDKLDENK